MKKIFLALSFISVMAACSLTGQAQATNKAKSSRTPKWVSNNGYWNIETNTHDRRMSTVYFYNNDHQLIYTEKVEGMVIRYKKRSVKLDMKKALDESVLAYNQKQQASENGMLVQNLIRHN
jgi:hypothetical protein